MLHSEADHTTTTTTTNKPNAAQNEDWPARDISHLPAAPFYQIQSNLFFSDSMQQTASAKDISQSKPSSQTTRKYLRRLLHRPASTGRRRSLP
jgi:hypothetical protein